jgi:hypothetical protein
VTKIYLSNLKPNGMEQRYKGRFHSGNFFSAKENFPSEKNFEEEAFRPNHLKRVYSEIQITFFW